MVADCGLGLGLEDSGLGLALGLGCCWTCYKSATIILQPRKSNSTFKIRSCRFIHLFTF